jgi:hypothetical protein
MDFWMGFGFAVALFLLYVYLPKTEYEMDGWGNPQLDEHGNPIKRRD